MRVNELVRILTQFPQEFDVELALGGTGDPISDVRVVQDNYASLTGKEPRQVVVLFGEY